MALPQVGVEVVIENIGAFNQGSQMITVRLGEMNEGADDLAAGSGKAAAGIGVMGAAAAAAVVVVAAAAAAVVALAAGMTKLGIEGTKAFVEFEGQINEVFTLLPDISGRAMDALTQQVQDFAVEFGTLPEEVIPALYQAISAGVPEENVFNFLEVAQKAAIGGVTELETAVDGISSVVNAYGADVISAAEASDLMFTAVKLGKTDFEQLSASLFNVIPTAASLGVSFEDVTAALATITAQGTPTSVATTQLRQLFVELSKSGTDLSDTFIALSGQSFQDFIAQGGNLQDALTILSDGTALSSTNMRDLFGSVEAANAAIGLTGTGAASFTSNLAEMNTATGATNQAFETMDEGLGRTQDRLEALKDVTLVGIGEGLSDVFGKFLESALQIATDVGPALVSIFGLIGDVLSTLFDTGMSFIQDFFPDFGSGVQGITSFVEALRDTFAGLTEEDIFAGLAESVAGIEGDLDSALASLAESHTAMVESINSDIASMPDALAGTLAGISESFAAKSAEVAEEFASKISKINSDIARANEDLARKIEDIQQRSADKRADIEQRAADNRRKIEQNIADTINKLQDKIADKREDLAVKIADINEKFAEKQLEIQQKIQDAIAGFAEEQANIQKKFDEERADVTAESDEKIKDLKQQFLQATTEEEKAEIMKRIQAESEARDAALAEIEAREQAELQKIQEKHDAQVALLQQRLADEEAERLKAVAKEEAETARAIERLERDNARKIESLNRRLSEEDEKKNRALEKEARDTARAVERAEQANQRRVQDLQQRLAQETAERDAQLAALAEQEAQEIATAKAKNEEVLADLQARLAQEEAAFAASQQTLRETAIEEIAALQEEAQARVDALSQFEAPLGVFTEVLDGIKEIAIVIRDDLMPAIQEVWDVISPILLDISNAIVEAFGGESIETPKELGEVIGDMAKKITTGLKVMAVIIKKTLGIVKKLWDKHKEKVLIVVRIFTAILSGKWEDVWKEIKKFVEETLGDILKGLITWAGDMIEEIITWAGDMIGEFQTWASDMIGELITWASDMVGEFIVWAGDMVGELITWASDMVGEFQTWASDMVSELIIWAGDMIAEFIIWAGDMVSELITWAGDMISEFQTWASDMVGELITWAGDMIGEFQTWASDMIGELITWGSDMVSEFIIWAGDMVGELVTWGSDMIGEFQTWAGDMVGELTIWAGDMIAEFIVFVGDFLQEVTNWVGEIATTITDAWDGVVTTISDLLSGLVDLVKPGSPVYDTIVQIGTEIINAIVAGIQAVGDFISRVETQLITWFNDLTTSIGSVGSDIFNALRDFGVGLIDGIIAGLAAAGTFVSGFTDQLVTWFGDVITAIGDTAVGVGETIASIGSAIIDTVVTGWTNWANTVGNFAANVRKFIVDALGGFSLPNLTEVANGIIDAMVAAISSLTSVGRRLIGAIADALGLPFGGSGRGGLLLNNLGGGPVTGPSVAGPPLGAGGGGSPVNNFFVGGNNINNGLDSATFEARVLNVVRNNL